MVTKMKKATLLVLGKAHEVLGKKLVEE